MSTVAFAVALLAFIASQFFSQVSPAVACPLWFIALFGACTLGYYVVLIAGFLSYMRFSRRAA